MLFRGKQKLFDTFSLRWSLVVNGKTPLFLNFGIRNPTKQRRLCFVCCSTPHYIHQDIKLLIMSFAVWSGMCRKIKAIDLFRFDRFCFLEILSQFCLFDFRQQQATSTEPQHVKSNRVDLSFFVTDDSRSSASRLERRRSIIKWFSHLWCCQLMKLHNDNKKYSTIFYHSSLCAWKQQQSRKKVTSLAL